MLIELCEDKSRKMLIVWPCPDFWVNLVILSGRHLEYSEATLNISLKEKPVEHTATFCLLFIGFLLVWGFFFCYENRTSQGNNFSVCHLGTGGTCRWDFLLSMVHSQEKMENKFERRSVSTDFVFAVVCCCKKCSIFSFSFWQFLVAWKNAIVAVRE